MIKSVIIAVISICISVLLTWVLKFYLIKKNILDNPNNRSSHTVPTPRGGGIAIVIVWFIGLIYLFYNNQIPTNLFFALISGLILVVVGILDDIFDLKPKIRIIAQFTTVALALFFLKGLQSFHLGFYNFQFEWILTILAFIGIVWFINLYNFLDGIDGYAGLQAIFISMSLFYFTSSSFYILLAGACLGFLILNWQPAKIFMGDVGSTLLGFNFAIFAIYEQNNSNISLIVFLILTSLFWFDATFTLFRRFRNKEKLSVAHRKHAYQRIVQSGFSHQKTTLYALILNLLLFCFAVVAHKVTYISTLILISTTILMYFVTVLVDKRKKFEKA